VPSIGARCGDEEGRERKEAEAERAGDTVQLVTKWVQLDETLV
jgi:hypothetical protein